MLRAASLGVWVWRGGFACGFACEPGQFFPHDENASGKEEKKREGKWEDGGEGRRGRAPSG